LGNILIFRLALALNKHGLKMLVLGQHPFRPTISLQSTFWATQLQLTSFFVWHTVLDDLFKMVTCFYTVE